jgi:hypothetical protein
MNTNTVVSTLAVAATQPVTHLNSQPQPVVARVLKLALDVHLLEHVVAMQYDGSGPKPPQRFKPKDFLTWVEKQSPAAKLGRLVTACTGNSPHWA